MSGRIKQLIDELIQIRTAGKPGSEHFVRANLVLNGIEPERYTDRSDDDQQIIVKLEQMISIFRKE